MESFFLSLKAERTYLTHYASYQEAKNNLSTGVGTAPFTVKRVNW